MTISLIITTFNWKEALELVIQSVFKQTVMPNEIVIADDGSNEETARMIDRASTVFPVPIFHLWQENKGFRAAMVRNKAIARSTSEYIILVDGDMILHKDFVKDHRKAARPHFFSQGSRVLLTQDKTLQTLREKRVIFSLFEYGLLNRKNALHLPTLSRFFPGSPKSLKGIRTCNFAFWKSDALAVNGFNEDFEGWGREDSEFAARLLNSGLLRQNLRFRALAYHLFHPHHSQDSLHRNQSILDRTISDRSVRCGNGIDKYLNSESLP